MMGQKYQTKSFILFAVQFYTEVCNEFAKPISASFRLRATQLHSKKCCSGGEPLATLCPIWQARDLNLRPPALETNVLPLDQVAGKITAF